MSKVASEKHWLLFPRRLTKILQKCIAIRYALQDGIRLSAPRRLLTVIMPNTQYDTDVTTWSPQGRLFQVEYAMEAVKQGSAIVGVTSKTHAVLAAIKRSPSELASYQQKVFRIDDHLGMAMSGLTADGRSLCKCVYAPSVRLYDVLLSPRPN